MPNLIEELTRLQDASERYQQATGVLDRCRQERDDAIVDVSLAGTTRRQVAEITGLTVGRVQQILDSARKA